MYIIGPGFESLVKQEVAVTSGDEPVSGDNGIPKIHGPDITRLDLIPDIDMVVGEMARLRLQEWGIKYGMSRSDHRKGHAQCVANGCATWGS